MTHQILSQHQRIMRVIFASLLAASLLLLLASFTISNRVGEDFLKQLGIGKLDADAKITSSFLDGYFDAYGVKNAKNLAAGNRSAITRSLLDYTKQYVSSPEFIKAYNALRESKKPVVAIVKTPEQFQQEIIATAKKSIADVEQQMKKADASMKPVFEKMLESIRKQIQQAEDPNNRSMAGYRNGYAVLVKNRDETYAKEVAVWEARYPAAPNQFIKQRLLQFLKETEQIDFTATLYEKNGKKYFTNPAYESKGIYWKMGFRAGREVVEPSRAFAETWVKNL